MPMVLSLVHQYLTAAGPFEEGLRSSLMSQATSVVFVVDDDPSVRESLALLIDSAGWRPETFASAQDFLSSKPVPSAATCMVLDVCLPDFDGLELQNRIGVNRRSLPIIFISGRGDVPTSVRAMKGGAVDFLMKPYDPGVLLDTIGKALEGSRATLVLDAQLQALRERYASLTPRECQVMGLVVTGLLNKQVGGELGISEITVKAHRGQVMRKMNADSLADLVTRAAKLRVEPLPASSPQR
jgi:FixJ family two-component response regulator